MPNRRANHDLVDISGELQAETEKAYLLFDGTTKIWLPKSQVEWNDETKTMTMPEWMALEKGLI